MTLGGPYALYLTAFILNGFGMGFLVSKNRDMQLPEDNLDQS